MDGKGRGVENFWFLDTLVRVQVATDEAAGLSVLEHWVPFGDSPPLHIHQTEDEVFHILEGAMTFRIHDQERHVAAGETLLAPRGIPHTYRADAAGGGRFLTVTARGDFERMVRELGRPAPRLELPPPSGPPTPEAMATLTATARKHGIEIVGPPLPRRG